MRGPGRPSRRASSVARLELVFLGTRGGIEKRSRRHRRHSVLLVRHGCARIMLDCGADWRHRVARLAPTAIVVTHGHPDHVLGLAHGVACPVYATRPTWRLIGHYPIASRQLVALGKPWSIAGVCFEAFAVDHSTRAPAVGYRVSIGSLAIFYVPDVVAIRRPTRALAGVALYIGDGASLVRPILRRQAGRRVGHTTIGEQLRWCADAAVRNAIFTHCGSWIAKDGRRADALLRRFRRQFGVQADIAYDGLRILLSA